MGKNQTSATDDQLVTMHKKARKRKKRKFVITLVSVFAIGLIVLIVGVTVLRRRVAQQVASSQSSEVESAEVTVGSISTTVSGSGTLAAEDVETLEILNSLEIIDYYVEAGDSVEEGDLIATVTNASLVTAMSDKQAELDEIDEELAEAASDEVSDTIEASVEGRVKLINVEADDDVATAMYEHGALMALSLDGYMAVDVETEILSAGDEVTVTLSDESTVDGLVEKRVDGIATILVTDKGTTYGDTATVLDSEENEIGSGELYIHSQMQIVGYAGTISSVKVSENEYVSEGETLLTLTDTETSANYDTLLKERKEVEEQLNNLIKIYKEGGICASVAGVVDSVETSTESETSASNMYAAQSADTSGTTTVATISPNTSMAITISVDETDILSISQGQEASVSIDSIGEDVYEGVVTEVNTTATSDSGVTAYSATVNIDKTEEMLSGMSASVVITIEGNDNALLVPVDAVHQTSSKAYVYTEYDEETGEFSGMQEVTIGLSNSTYVEITDGLSEGDTVYYTASEEDSMFGSGMMNFGNMQGGGFGGGMPGGDSMPSFEDMPSGGSMSGGAGMPSGGNMPGRGSN